MGVLLACLEATHHEPWYVAEVGQALDKIALSRPDLTERYQMAFSRRSGGEMERLLLICQELLRHADVSIGNLRINAVTKRFHVGDGHGSVPLFPNLQGI